MATFTATTQLLPGAEPFHFDAPGDVACVLSHGFTGSPNEVRYLGRHLADLGITARGVLLAGHGTRPEDMALHSYRRWIAELEQAVDELQADGKRVFVGGLSMGGTLALNLAARRRDDPRLLGVISLAAPLRVADWRLAFLPVLQYVLRWHNWGKPDIKDESAWERHVAYRRFHVKALVQFLKLLEETRRLAPAIHQPVLVIHSRHDNTVPAANAELILRLIRSQDRKLVWLDNCYHVMTLDYDSERVHQEVATFIREHS